MQATALLNRVVLSLSHLLSFASHLLVISLVLRYALCGALLVYAQDDMFANDGVALTLAALQTHAAVADVAYTACHALGNAANNAVALVRPLQGLSASCGVFSTHTRATAASLIHCTVSSSRQAGHSSGGIVNTLHAGSAFIEASRL